MVRVLYFAACRERTGISTEEVDAAGTVADVVAAVVARHPALAAVAPRCRVAVNQAFAQSSDRVPDGAELALIPPVAGG
jgi:molybdopterin synthase catalytic subunit